MNEKGLKMVGRGIDGTAKAVKTDNDGALQVGLVKGVLGKNLIDPDNLITGYITSTGATTWDTSWRSTDYISVVAGESLVLSNLANSAVAGAAFYNASNVLVSWISNNDIKTALGVMKVPTNATKLRVTNNRVISVYNKWQLERGTVATDFEPYKISLHRQIEDLTKIVREIKDKEDNQEPPLQEILTDLEYTEMPYDVIASSHYSTYAVDENKSLYSSFDGGDTWVATGWVFTNRVTKGLVLDRYNSVESVKLIVFDGKNVIKSTDSGTSFVPVLTDVSPPLPHGFYGNDNTIIFGEYTVTGSPTNTVRLWKSTDSGDTWTVALTLTDVTHFHTVKYFSSLGWYATTGDTEEGSRFYFSSDNGVTWKEVARGYEYRTVGLSRTSKDVILWASDHSERGIFAAKHGFIKSTTRRINSITGMCLGIAGEDDVIITSTRTELDTQKGSFVNPVYLSTDGGATWNIDYFRESLAALNGMNGILGPNGQGDFFLKYTWTKGLTTPNATIRARRKNTKKLLGSPVQSSTTKEFIKLDVLDKPLQLDVGESELIAFSSILPYSHIVDANLYIKNTHLSTLTLSFMRAGSTVYKSNGDDINLTIPADKQIIIAVKDLGLEFIDKDISIKIEPTESLVDSQGNVSVELTGEHFVPTDVRRM